mmetsp:Transcript_8797/g.26195  ORF Transcript_8797/g.26195 Transcript_8797/m.26195 type:complete len:292 (-) Transcript_8797:157-1032(-)
MLAVPHLWSVATKQNDRPTARGVASRGNVGDNPRNIARVWIGFSFRGVELENAELVREEDLPPRAGQRVGPEKRAPIRRQVSEVGHRRPGKAAEERCRCRRILETVGSGYDDCPDNGQKPQGAHDNEARPQQAFHQNSRPRRLRLPHAKRRGHFNARHPARAGAIAVEVLELVSRLAVLRLVPVVLEQVAALPEGRSEVAQVAQRHERAVETPPGRGRRHRTRERAHRDEHDLPRLHWVAQEADEQRVEADKDDLHGPKGPRGTVVPEKRGDAEVAVGLQQALEAQGRAQA